jgi:hypothetical protein
MGQKHDKIYTIIILPTVLPWCKTFCLAIRNIHREGGPKLITMNCRIFILKGMWSHHSSEG